MIIVFWDIKMISKGYNEIRYMIEYRYGILSQLISDNTSVKIYRSIVRKDIKFPGAKKVGI